jgi:hypothetical protein
MNIKPIMPVYRLSRLKELLSSSGKGITFVMEATLEELSHCCDIDGLNDFAQRYINVDGAHLSDISFKIVGCKEGTATEQGSVFIEVEASTAEFELEES